MSPFFIVHSYEIPSVIALESEPAPNSILAVAERASMFIEKIRKISDLYQVTIAASSQKQEESANRN
jgi:hypothetical protein